MIDFRCCRLLYTTELDPLVVELQNEIDRDQGFDSDHIFYKLIKYGIQSAKNAWSLDFKWPNELVDFANSLEASGGEKTMNLLRGCGMLEDDRRVSDKYWHNINIPVPSKTTRQRRKPKQVTSNGVLTQNVKHFQQLALETPPLVKDEKRCIIPVCIARDAMAIKASGDLDMESNTIIGLTENIDLKYVKENPLPDPETLKEKFYSEAGAIIASTVDNGVSLLLANDFLVKRTSGQQVFDTLSNVIRCIQTCVGCLRDVSDPVIDVDTASKCDSSCQDCIELGEVCELCSVDGLSSIHTQLRPCRRCVLAQTTCTKIAVIGVSMDCESNNAWAMKALHKDDVPSHLHLTHAIADAVHGGKKIFRASSNWWLWVEGYLVNNQMLRCLRQFDDSLGPQLRNKVSDSALRGKDRMDYGTILECTDAELGKTVTTECNGLTPLTTTTIYPDPFWQAKTKGIISSLTGICSGKL